MPRAKTIDEAVDHFFKDIIATNEKILTGMEHMLSMEDIDVDQTPKALLYQEDRMRLFHYDPIVAKPHSMPILITYALSIVNT